MRRELPYTTAWQVMIFDMQDHCESMFFKNWEHAQAYAKAKNASFLATPGCLKDAQTRLIPIWEQPCAQDNTALIQKDLNRIEKEIDNLLFKAEMKDPLFNKEATKEKEN